MLRVAFDDWPLLVTIATGALDADDVTRACAGFEEAFARGGRFASLVDASGLDALPPALLRKAYTTWREAHLWDLRRHVIAVGVHVGDRPFVRGAFTALTWLVPHPSPEAFFTRYDDALRFCRNALWAEAPRGR